MDFSSLSIRNKMLILILTMLTVFDVVLVLLNNHFTAKALDQNLSVSLRIITHLAAHSAKQGVEFDHDQTVQEAVMVFSELEEISFVSVTDKNGKEYFRYRKNGYPEINLSAFNPRQYKNEIFTDKEIQSGQDVIGQTRIGLSLEGRNQALASARRSTIITILAAILLAAAAIVLIAGRLIGPISFLSKVALDMSQGNVNQHIEYESKDELGVLAGSFREMIGYIKNVADSADKISQGDLTTEVRIYSKDDILSHSFKRLNTSFSDIFNKLHSQADVLQETSGHLQNVSGQLATDSGSLNEMSQSVASATEEMSANIAAVSGSIGEMTLSVSEIARNAEGAREVTAEAVKGTKNISTLIDGLDVSAGEINKVIEVITEIAEQTKLLALNATIEAARAGEYGKGFAVVATEVKELAKQTNTATGEIKTKIETMQNATASVVNEIKSISGIVKQVNEMVVAIAAAVEEQTATTQDIASNVNQAADTSRMIAKDVIDNSTASTNVYKRSKELNEYAQELGRAGVALTQIVRQYRYK